MHSTHNGYDIQTRVYGEPTDTRADITVSLNGVVLRSEESFFGNQPHEEAESSADSLGRSYADKHRAGEDISTFAHVK